jgi:Tyrosine phosphatase family
MFAGKILRSACPTGASTADVQLLREELGIRELVDLRSGTERKEDGRSLLLENADVFVRGKMGVGVMVRARRTFDPRAGGRGGQPAVLGYHRCCDR